MPEITDGKYDPGDRLVSPSGEELATWTGFGEAGAWQVCGGGRFTDGSTCFLLAFKCGATVQRDVPLEPIPADVVEFLREAQAHTSDWTRDQAQAILRSRGLG